MDQTWHLQPRAFRVAPMHPLLTLFLISPAPSPTVLIHTRHTISALARDHVAGRVTTGYSYCTCHEICLLPLSLSSLTSCQLVARTRRAGMYMSPCVYVHDMWPCISSKRCALDFFLITHYNSDTHYARTLTPL